VNLLGNFVNILGNFACAKLFELAASRFVVGSSSARMPQLMQNDSASANRMTRQARTWGNEKRE
tara:strand:- start:45 stop:236 length:192 start_codon:yes stop_codon:yes gene_type:complete